MKKKGQEKGRNTFGNWVVKEKKNEKKIQDPERQIATKILKGSLTGVLDIISRAQATKRKK